MPDGHDRDDKEREEGKFEGRTYLYIRTNPLDDGTEPLPANLACWVSPDIVVVKPDGTRGTEAAANETNQIEVTVTNAGGIQAVDAFVDAFFGHPSTGWTPSTAYQIGSGYLTIPGYSTAAIQFPWMPTSAQSGHGCLFARVSLIIPPDSYANPATFDARGDRHVAQRNINVVGGTPAAGSTGGAKPKAFSFRFMVVNPVARGGQFTVRAQALKVGRRRGEVQAALGWGPVAFAAKPANDVRIAIGEPLADRQQPENDRELDREAKGETGYGVTPRPVDLKASRTQKLKMAAGEVRDAVITVTPNPDAEAGEISVIEVTQEDARRRNVGGLWIVFAN